MIFVFFCFFFILEWTRNGATDTPLAGHFEQFSIH